MKYAVKPSSTFQKDLKRIEKRGYHLALLTEVIKTLANGDELPIKYRDHSLSGEYSRCRECHITPDWLLIFFYLTGLDEMNEKLYKITR